MCRIGWLVVVLCGACGDVTSSPDAASDAPGRACDLEEPFQLRPVGGLNSAFEEGYAWLSDDLLTAYIGSNRPSGPGAWDIFRATRASTDLDFGTPVVEDVVSTTKDERGPTLMRDRLTMYYSKLHESGVHYDVYVATRLSTAAAFSAGELMLNINGTSDEHVSYISKDGLVMYVSSLRTGDWEIYRTTRPTTGDEFGPLTPVAALNVAGVADYSAVVTADELTVFFASYRVPTEGGYDIYVATRTTTQDGFGEPKKVIELASAALESPAWVSSDGCHLVILSDRTGGSGGGTDVWMASRPR